MDLGTRSIRSSGRGSGSIEITLPSRLRALSGLACRMSWHDGPPPQLRLAPDLGAAETAMDRLWALLLAAQGLPAAPRPALPISLAGPTALWWDEALALSRPGPHEAMVVSRAVCALGSLAWPEPAGLAPALAFLATGAVPDPRYRLDCAIAGAAFAARAAAPLDAFGNTLWAAVGRLVQPLLALQQALAAAPDRHAALREAAGAGARLDLGGLLP